jgi:hypothetical protein
LIIRLILTRRRVRSVHCHKAYIGLGEGADEKYDSLSIAQNGAKFYPYAAAVWPNIKDWCPMILESIISIVSFLILLFFAYGTWRIDRTLREVRDILDRTEDVLRSRLPSDDR